TCQGVSCVDRYPYVLNKITVFSPLGSIYTQPYDMRTPTNQSWNLSIQREVAPNWLVSASYVGTAIRHLWSSNSISPAIYIPGASCTLKGVTYNPCSST